MKVGTVGETKTYYPADEARKRKGNVERSKNCFTERFEREEFTVLSQMLLLVWQDRTAAESRF